MRRKPLERRWDADEVEKIKRVPWDKAEGKKDDDGQEDVFRPGGAFERLPETLQEQEKKEIREELNMPKSFNSRREDYDQHGYTRGCPGCRALLTGTTRQKHSAQCRNRMMGEMRDDERVKTAKRRREEFLEKVTVGAGPGDKMTKEDLEKVTVEFLKKAAEDDEKQDMVVDGGGAVRAAPSTGVARRLRHLSREVGLRVG